MNAGSESEPSPSSDSSRLLDVKRGGLRRRRLCAGGSESDSEDDEGEERVSGSGDRMGGERAVEEGRGWDLGDIERRCGVACAGRGEVCGRFRDVTVVFADDVRENGGAIDIRDHPPNIRSPDIPVGLPAGAPGTASVRDIELSFRVDNAEDNRGP